MDIKALVEKWGDILNEGSKIKNNKVLKATALMLENQNKYLMEAGNFSQLGLNRDAGYATSGDFHQIAIPMVRRTFPELIAHEIVGVQPMTGPVGLAFALRFKPEGSYTGDGPANYQYGVAYPSDEAGYNRIDTGFSGSMITSAGEILGSNSSGDIGLGVGAGTAIKEINMTVEKAQVEAKTRKLRSRWSLEVAQDLKAMHGLDLEEEMMDILAYEITAEIDREVVNKMNTVAVSGDWDYNSPTDADGRWQAEKYRTLYNMVVRKANAISVNTRRGAGNFVVASPYVCAALEGLSSFVVWPVKEGFDTLTSGIAKMGSLDGRLTVYRDTFAAVDYLTVGYKGPSEYDAGIIYLPYVQLMVSKTIYEQSFHPTVGLMSRYAIHEHIFGSNLYYQYVRCYNLPQ